MRVLALDVGDRRIGVAVSDPSGTIASPVTAIEAASEARSIDAVLRLAAEYAVEEIVVGLPLTLSGEVGTQAKKVQAFINRLSLQSQVPVTPLDERLSTVQAQRMMRDAGPSRARDRGRVDAAAAAVVLQAYLDGGKTGHGEPGYP